LIGEDLGVNAGASNASGERGGDDLAPGALALDASSPFHQNAYMKSCLFPSGVVVRRCHSYGYVASSRLASLKNPSISFRNLFDETDY